MITSNYIPPEKTLTLKQAFSNITQEISNLRLSYKLTTYSGGGYYTYRCTLIDENGNFASIGNGKGDNYESSLVGAMFESLEHFFYEKYCLNNLNSYSLSQIKQQTQYFEDDTALDILLSSNPNAQAIPTYTYQNSNNELIHYPAILACPAYLYHQALIEDDHNYSSAKRYSSNNGMAIGANSSEALLHAIHEVIERDALSLLLIYYFLLKKSTPFKVIDEKSLPPKFVEKLILAKQFINHDVVIIQAVSEFGIPVFIARPINGELDSLPLIGCGASLSKEYALTRALSELIQCYSIYKNDSKAFKMFEQMNNTMLKFPQLYDAFKINIEELAIEYINYHDIHEYKLNDNSITNQLDLLHRILEIQGYNVYHRKVWESDLVSCVGILIPGLERFFLNSSGNPVIPSKSGVTRSLKLYGQNQ